MSTSTNGNGTPSAGLSLHVYEALESKKDGDEAMMPLALKPPSPFSRRKLSAQRKEF